MATQSVFNYASTDSPVVYHQGRMISLGELLQTVDYLYEKIPAHQYLLNLYEDRYYFLLGFLLSLKQRSISLLPSTITPHFLNQLKNNYADILLLSDTKEAQKGFQHCDLRSLINAADGQIAASSEPRSKQTALLIMPEIELSRQIAIIFTSGSTGQPEPYIKQWGDLVCSGRYLAEKFLSATAPRSKELACILATVPAQHMYGLEASIMMALQSGLLIHAEKPFFPQDITLCLQELAQAARHRGLSIAATLITTPLHIKACIKTDVSLPGVKQFICATAPLEFELAQLCEEHYCARVMEIFGCTEVGSMAWRRTVASEQWTVFADMTLETVNSQSDDKTKPDDVQIKTTRSIKNFLFNDIIELLDKQHFILKGRKEDLINLAGKRTSLAYLNHHLQSCDGLIDGCFYQHQESRLVAFVVLKQHGGEQQAKTEIERKQTILEIRNYLKNSIESVFLPKKIYFVKALPRNATGKLPMSELKTLLVQQETK